LPAHRSVNQRQKREKLPSAELLEAAQGRIQDWWDKGYLKSINQLLPTRFLTEVKATLPLIRSVNPTLDDLFAAVKVQQVRLKQDQQIPVWEPSAG
jgi:hypothetical protein